MRGNRAWLLSTLGAVVLVGAVVPATTAVAAAAPGPARHVFVQGDVDAGLFVAWILPPGADGAVACYRYDAVPTSPVPPPAGQGECSAPRARSVRFGYNEDQPAPKVAVFSYSSSTGLYGPAATDIDEVPPPFGVDAIESRGVDDHQLDLSWPPGGEHGAGGTTEWLVMHNVGRTPAAGPVAVLPVTATGTRVSGLLAGTLYTFSVQGRDAEGNLSEDVATLTTSTRTPGVFVQENRHPGNARVTSKAPASGTDPAETALAVTPSTGRMHLVYITGQPGLVQQLRYATRLPRAGWGSATLLAKGYNLGRVGVTRSRRGTVVVSWTDQFSTGCWRTKRAGHPWSRRRCLPKSSHLTGLVIDRSDRLHLVFDRTIGKPATLGVYYRTNARGRWSQYRVSPRFLSGPTRLLIDPVTDRVVLVRNQEISSDRQLVVSTKQPRAARFGKAARRTTGAWMAILTGATTYNNRITVAVDMFTLGGGQRLGAPRLLTGTTSGNLGRPIPVGGAGPRDHQLQVTAGSTNHVVVAWTRVSPIDDPADQGVFAARGAYDKNKQTWTFTVPSHRTTSAFDRSEAVSTDSTGHLYLAFRRVPTDRERLKP